MATPDVPDDILAAFAKLATPTIANALDDVGFSGVMEGSLANERRGSGGFGYDPVFLLPSGQTTAELPDADKDRISHRGRAVQAAMPRLRELLTAEPAPAIDR